MGKTTNLIGADVLEVVVLRESLAEPILLLLVRTPDAAADPVVHQFVIEQPGQAGELQVFIITSIGREGIRKTGSSHRTSFLQDRRDKGNGKVFLAVIPPKIPLGIYRPFQHLYELLVRKGLPFSS